MTLRLEGGAPVARLLIDRLLLARRPSAFGAR